MFYKFALTSQLSSPRRANVLPACTATTTAAQAAPVPTNAADAIGAVKYALRNSLGYKASLFGGPLKWYHCEYPPTDLRLKSVVRIVLQTAKDQGIPTTTTPAQIK